MTSIDYALREILDLNEYGFYSYMPDSVIKKDELGYYLKNRVIETYSYVSPTLEGETNFETFLNRAYDFFSNGNEYFILKHPVDENYQTNSKILRNRGFISAVFDVSVMYWKNAKEKLKPNQALRLVKISEEKMVTRWIEIFFDSFKYPKMLKEYITEMVLIQMEHNIEFYIGTVSNIDVSCFCAYNDSKIVGIYGVGTKTKFQRRGYATAMLSNYILKLLNEHEDVQLCLQVHKGSNAQRVYEKIGFKTAFIQKRFDWNPQIIFRKS